jgi:3-methyl-2-oxobutanoate hydroxymethyltransferase
MERSKVTVPHVTTLKHRKKIVMMTAYDFPQAASADRAGVDIVLVGDSLGNVVLGRPDTTSVTMDDMLHHTRAVRRGVKDALLVADMPYLSYHITLSESVRNAGRFIQEAGAQAVKVEGGKKRLPVIQALLDAEIPVMGHLGLTPQSVHVLGGYKVQGRSAPQEEALLEDALALEQAGVFSLVLECVPAALAGRITKALQIPTIGIGAGPECDGQVLVFHDLLGWSAGPKHTFVRIYADLAGEIQKGLAQFKEDVERGRFPSPEESF